MWTVGMFGVVACCLLFQGVSSQNSSRQTVCGIGQYQCADGGTCIDAWKRCDGNNDCGDGGDEDASKCACKDIPPSLTMCRGLEYQNMTLPNPLDYTHTTVEQVETFAGFGNLSALADSECHPRVRDLVCATILPRCESSPNLRQQLPCRSWCEEVKYSCEEEEFWSAFPSCEIFPHINCNNINTSTTPEGVECFDGNGANYRGDEAKDSRGGGTCLPWDDDYKEMYPWANLVENKCRNPNDEVMPWCYASSGVQFCDIIPCNVEGCKDPGRPLFGQRSPVLKFYWPGERIAYTCDAEFQFPNDIGRHTARCVIVNETTGEVNWDTPKPRCKVDQTLKLQKDLLSENVYNKAVPATNYIKIKAYVVNVIHLDEKSEQIITSFKAEYSWGDFRLNWEPKRYKDFDHIFILDDQIWKPTLTLERNADLGYSGEFPTTEVRLDHTGEVTWPVASLASTTCTLDPFFFPQDNMTCAVCWRAGEEYKLSCSNSTTHKDSNFLTCHNDEVDIVAGEWSGKTTLTATNNTACLIMTLQRDPTYHYSTTISPCFILIVLMIITFILPIDKGDRIGFGVTVLLSMVVGLVVVTDVLPVSSALPFTAMLIIVCMALMAFFMLWTVFTLIIHDRKGPVPKWARAVFLKHAARALLMGDLTEKLTDDSVSNKVDDIEGHTNHSQRRAIFVLHEMDDDGPSAEGHNSRLNVNNEVGETLIGVKGSVDELKVSVRQLSGSIDALAQAISGDDGEQVAEYALLTKVLDRLGLIFYIVAVIVAVPCTLYIGRKRVIPS